MDQSETIRFLEANLARQLAWVSAGDKKSALSFAINTAMLGVLAALAPKTAAEWGSAAGFFATITVIINMMSIVFLAISTVPRTEGPKESLIYFGRIQAQKIDDYVAATKNVTTEGYIDDLARQCHRNAEIVHTKYSWIQRANILLYISILPWLMALLLLYAPAGKAG